MNIVHPPPYVTNGYWYWNATIDRSKIHVLEWKLLLEMHAGERPPAEHIWQKFACRSEEVNDAVASPGR